MLESGSSADVVAKVVLKAVTSENPSLRYLAGKDVETCNSETDADEGTLDMHSHFVVVIVAA